MLLLYWVQDGEFRVVTKPRSMSEDMDIPEHDANDDDSDEDEDDDVDELPSFEFRFECAKLLLELDDTTTTVIQVHPSRHLLSCTADHVPGTTCCCSSTVRPMFVEACPDLHSVMQFGPGLCTMSCIAQRACITVHR